jgi:hypothetical protein
MKRANHSNRCLFRDSIIEKGHVGIVQLNTPKHLGHQFVLNSMDFDLPPQWCSMPGFPPSPAGAGSVVDPLVGVVEDEGPIRLTHPLPSLAADPISTFRGGAVFLILLLSDTI